MNDVLNFSKICRVCCTEGAMMSVFKVNIHKKIMACAAIQVWQSDGLPGQVCKKCIAKLHISFQFKKMCERSDTRLRQCKESGKFIDNKVNIDQNRSVQREPVRRIVQQPIHQELPPVLPEYSYSDCNSSLTDTRHYDSIQGINIGGHDILEPQLVYNGSNILTSMTNVNLQGQLQLPGNYNIQTLGNGSAYQNGFTVQNQAPSQMITLDSLSVPGQPYNLPQIDLTTIPEEKKEVKLIQASNRRRITSKYNVKKEKVVFDREVFRCPICTKIFPANGKLTRHMKTHSGELPYKCKVCRKGFSHSGNYKVHMRMHTGERPFACRMCHKTCRQQQDLDKHMRTHTGERPHICSTCQRGFTTSSNLTAHERIHSGEKPYVCSVCQKSFCQSNELTKHMRTHTGEKSHICPVCDKGFNGSSTLIVHLRIHTGERPYVCTICHKGFTQSSCLAVHARRHTAARAFKCPRCPRAFATALEMQTHVKGHAPANLRCPVPGCERRFSRPNDVLRHAKVHQTKKSKR